MKRKTHDRVARELARMLHLDERLVLMGARFPDLDLYIGKHRRTLHNPAVLALSTFVSPDFFVGVGSHLILDSFSQIEKIYNMLERVFRVCAET